MTQIHDLTVLELAAAVRQRELSPAEITSHYLDRIERLNAEVGAFYTVTADLARDQADQAEKAVARAADPDSLPPLTGVPIPIKDLNMVAGVRQTLGSLAFEDNVPAQDDHVTAQLRAGGAVITGKTATPEFGLPCYTETRIGPPARTPWDLSRSAGGSSGGPRRRSRPAAVSRPGQRRRRLDPDPGQRVRPVRAQAEPRADLFHGPEAGESWAGATTDGVLTRTVRGHRAAARRADRSAARRHVHPAAAAGQTFLGHARREPGRLRIGRTLQHAVEGGDVHPDCVAAYEDASALLASLGHEVEDIAPPFGPDVVPFFETLWYAMATLAPVDPAREHQLLPLTRYLRERGQALHAPISSSPRHTCRSLSAEPGRY